MEQNRPTNPFTSGVSTAAPDSFQAAIDYLIANRKKPVVNNQGLFTQPAQPAPATKPSVVTGLFGDKYIQKPEGGGNGISPEEQARINKFFDSMTPEQLAQFQQNQATVINNLLTPAPIGLLDKGLKASGQKGFLPFEYGDLSGLKFTGNPFTSAIEGVSPASAQDRINSYNNYRDIAAGLRNNKDAISAGAGMLTQVNPMFAGLGLITRYAAPPVFDYLANREYQSMLDAYQPNNNQYTDMAGNPIVDDMGPGARGSSGYNDFMQSRGEVVSGPIDTSPVRGTSLDSGGGGYGTSYDGGSSYSNQDQADRDVGNMS
jgi:hypothetical protein